MKPAQKVKNIVESMNFKVFFFSFPHESFFQNLIGFIVFSDYDLIFKIKVKKTV